MAIGDLFSGGMLTSNVLLKLRVDTSDAKRGLKDLAGEEKKAAQAAIALQEQKNKQMESWAKGIAKVTVGMQLAQKAVSLLGDSWKAYEKHAMAAGGADKEKAIAFRGALNDMSKAVNGFAVAIGGIVANLAPLVSLAAELLNIATKVLQLPGMLVSSGGMSADEWRRASQRDFDKIAGAQFYGSKYGGRAMSSADIAQQGNIDARMMTGENIMRLVRTEMAKERGRGGGQGSDFGLSDLLGGPNLAGAARGVGTGVDIGGRVSGSPFSGALGQGIDFSGSPVLDAKTIQDSANAMRDITAEYSSYQGRFLESIFGPVETFSLYKDGFELLSGAAQGAFDAWVSGSLTAGQAIKKFFADAISGVASQMFAQAIQHGAFAIGSLAFGDFRGAATHGKAAAMFGAGAIAVGALARQMNGGGGGSAGGGSVPSVTGGGGGGGGGGSQTNYYFVGDGFSEDGPAWRKQKAERTVRLGRGATSGGGVTDG